MNKLGIKRGFTLVELLIVVAILALLSGAAYIGIQRSQTRVMNEKVANDLSAIVNAVEQYKQDNGTYPIPTTGADKNVNCFKADTSYSHECTAGYGAAFIQAMVDNTLLTKRYLQEVPTDPRTKSRYVYGVTTDGEFFQVAGNHLENSGAWTARVQGNVEDGYTLPSLIRAFDGPNFVMDSGDYLPYSPDHLSITARLDSVTGSVTIDGQSAITGDIISIGETVNTDMGASAVLYFSDGSVTYLDSGTSLQLLPNSEVPQNDEDGIITKIRLKLFQGKIWSKVARLAAESEFNVETTSAIAGVRGTEFGIDAAGQELIVLSGEVVAREMDATEQSTANNDGYLVFDNTSNSFNLTDHQAVGNGNTYQQFGIPTPAGTMTAGTAVSGTIEQHINQNFYKGPFNNNYRPRIINIDTTGTPVIDFQHMEGVFKIIAMDPSEKSQQGSWDGMNITEVPGQTLSIDPSTITLYSAGSKVKFRFEDAFGNMTGFSDPVVQVQPNLALTETDIHHVVGQKQAQQNCQGGITFVDVVGPSKVVAGTNSNQYKAYANYPGNCFVEVTSQCNWMTPTHGVVDINGVFTVNPFADGTDVVNCTYQAINGNPQTLTVLSEVHAECAGPDLVDNTMDDKGHWIMPHCWVLAQDDTQNCDTACGAVLSNKGQCDNVNNTWDDTMNCDICKILIADNTAMCDFNNVSEAPFVFDNTNICRYRSTGNSSCAASQAGRVRICACVSL